MYAICDPNFPGMQQFRDCRWLLHHPAVLQTRYEDFITFKNQEPTVRKVTAFLGIQPFEHGITVYDRNSPTFREGKTRGWRKSWNAKHHNEFNRRYAQMLDDYGYHWAARSAD